jgi:hypothetical protein
MENTKKDILTFVSLRVFESSCLVYSSQELFNTFPQSRERKLFNIALPTVNVTLTNPGV